MWLRSAAIHSALNIAFWRAASVSTAISGRFGDLWLARGLRNEMLNVECSMLSVEWMAAARSLIQHSTFNIEHSTFALGGKA
jgi:hypothetical protein